MLMALEGDSMDFVVIYFLLGVIWFVLGQLHSADLLCVWLVRTRFTVKHTVNLSRKEHPKITEDQKEGTHQHRR